MSLELQNKAKRMVVELGYTETDPQYPAVQQACLSYFAGLGVKPTHKEKAQERSINRAVQPWGSV